MMQLERKLGRPTRGIATKFGLCYIWRVINGENAMSWIKTIAYDDADARLRPLYDRVSGPDNNVDNIMMSHALRPHSMEGHMAIYKAVLHHKDNSLPKWFLETIGVWVSLRNQCQYCVEHHFVGLKRGLRNDAKANAIRAGFEAGAVSVPELSEAQNAAMIYAAALTDDPARVDETLIHAMRDAGLSDGEILEVNQVTAYFAYANRTVLGLGCSLVGDDIGLSPNNSDDPNDWAHR